MTRKLAIATGALLVVGLTIVPLTDSGPQKPRVILPDGSVLTVERVTSQVPHLYYFDTDSLWSRLSRKAPAPLRRFLPATGQRSPIGYFLTDD